MSDNKSMSDNKNMGSGAKPTGSVSSDADKAKQDSAKQRTDGNVKAAPTEPHVKDVDAKRHPEEQIVPKKS